jgi:hypothetical protein
MTRYALGLEQSLSQLHTLDGGHMEWSQQQTKAHTNMCDDVGVTLTVTTQLQRNILFVLIRHVECHTKLAVRLDCHGCSGEEEKRQHRERPPPPPHTHPRYSAHQKIVSIFAKFQ